MTLKRNEDKPTPSEVYNFGIWVQATIVAFASIMIGYDSAFVGGSLALSSFKTEFGTIDKNTSANLVSTYQAGASVGALVGLPMGFYFGRKWSLIAAALIFTLGSIIMTIASSSTGLGPIYGGRAVAGLAIGIASNLAPTLISELAPNAIRGQLVGMWEVGWQIGGLVGFWINYGVSSTLSPTSTTAWRIPFAVQLIPGGMLLIGSLFLVESPRWLLSRGRDAEAERNLCKIRKLPMDEPTGYMHNELSEYKTALAAHRAVVGTGFFGPIRFILTNRSMLWRLALGSSLFAFQNGTGINAVNYFSPQVFKALGITGTNTGLLTTGIFGIIKSCGAVVWIWLLIDRFGRRKILIGGSVGGAFAMFWIAIYIAVSGVGKPGGPTGSLTAGGRSALAAFYIWTIFYGSTWNGTPWVVGAEIFPSSARPVGMAMMAFSNWIYNFAIARATPFAFAWSSWGYFAIFGALMLLSIPWVFFLLPETKGVPLEFMDELFASKERTWRAGPELMDRLRARDLPSNSMAGTHGETHSDGTSTPDDKESATHVDTRYA